MTRMGRGVYNPQKRHVMAQTAQDVPPMLLERFRLSRRFVKHCPVTDESIRPVRAR
jgi:hypothetical protein